MMSEPVFKDSRKAAYLNAEGAEKPLRSPVSREVLDRARTYRLQRLRDQCAAADCTALLLTIPAISGMPSIAQICRSGARTIRFATL